MKSPFHSKMLLIFLNSYNKITGTSLYILLHGILTQHYVTKYSLTLYTMYKAQLLPLLLLMKRQLNAIGQLCDGCVRNGKCHQTLNTL